MGVGGRYLVSELNIFDSDGDEADVNQIEILKKNVRKRSKNLGIRKMWKFVNGNRIEIHTDSAFSSDSYKGEPEVVIPYFLVIWEQAEKLNLTVDSFHIPYIFEGDSGSLVFDNNMLKNYFIGDGIVTVAAWNLDNLNGGLQNLVDMGRHKGVKEVELIEK